MRDDLPADVAEALGILLSADDAVHRALRAQIPHVRVAGRCACGCGTAYFDTDTDAVAPAPTGVGTVVAADAQVFTAAGECPGEVLVFTRGGYLSWLEVCSRSEDIEVTLDAALGRLRARTR
ncbi:hypothetical protein AB0K09_20090 [Streptomyces sp. NPDC049577]|uniref:hypothetical protein n=1 Tax=Streptomyces sp. NPDC049577 TaxID=3155153 RepID=UPI00344500C7